MSCARIKSPVLVGIACLSLVAAFFAGRSVPVVSSSKRAASAEDSPASVVRLGGSRQLVSAGATAAERVLGMLELLDRCETEGDFKDLISLIETRADKSEKQRFLALLFGEWLKKDPIPALSEVRRVELLRRDSGRVGGAFFQWASVDPSAAAALLAQVLDGRQGDPVAKPPFLDGVDPPDFLLSIVAGLSSSDPKLAAVTLAGAGESPVRTTAVEVLLQDWYAADPVAVRDWASSVNDPLSRRTAIEVAATEAGQRDDVRPGISWAMDLSDEAERRAALLALTGQWSQRHSADAFAWAKELADEDLKLKLMPGVLRQFAIMDPGAAADWLNLYDASPAMDESIAAYAKAIRFTNPPAALGSAAAITDPELREAVVSSIKGEPEFLTK